MSCRSPARTGRGAIRTPTPMPAPHLRSGAVAWRGAEDCGIEMRVGPVSITNGAFGNRPHCIYRGFCLQGCKVNAKASPSSPICPTRSSTGSRCGPSPWSCAWNSTSARPRDRRHVRQDGREHFQPLTRWRCAATRSRRPGCCCNSTSRATHGLGNGSDQLGRYVMVQGATQVAGRFPMDLRMYKAPPPEVSSEQFYETDPDAKLRRGFSIQTVSRCRSAGPSTSRATAIGAPPARVHARLQPLDRARRALRAASASPRTGSRWPMRQDQFGMPVAHFSHSLCENDSATSPSPPRR